MGPQYVFFLILDAGWCASGIEGESIEFSQGPDRGRYVAWSPPFPQMLSGSGSLQKVERCVGFEEEALETVSHLIFKGHSRKSKLYAVRTVSVDLAQRSKSPVTAVQAVLQHL